MKYKIITTAIAVSLAGGFCFAEEAEVSISKDLSLRIALGIAPGIDEAEGPLTGTLSAEDGSGSRLEVLVVKRWWSQSNPNIGGSFGGGLFFGGHDGETAGGLLRTDLAVFGGMIQGGFIAKAGENIVFEVGPYLGIGVANNETTGYTDGNGAYALFGVKGGAFVLLGENVELGLELGLEGFSHDQEFDYGYGTEEVTFSGSGAHVAAVLAVKF